MTNVPEKSPDAAGDTPPRRFNMATDAPTTVASCIDPSAFLYLEWVPKEFLPPQKEIALLPLIRKWFSWMKSLRGRT